MISGLIIRTVSATVLTAVAATKEIMSGEDHHRSFIIVVFALYQRSLNCLTGLEGGARRGIGFRCVVERSDHGIDIVPFE